MHIYKRHEWWAWFLHFYEDNVFTKVERQFISLLCWSTIKICHWNINKPMYIICVFGMKNLKKGKLCQIHYDKMQFMNECIWLPRRYIFKFQELENPLYICQILSEYSFFMVWKTFVMSIDNFYICKFKLTKKIQI